MSSAKYGHNPHPSLMHYIDNAGNYQQVEEANPLPVGLTATISVSETPIASASQSTVSITSVSSEVKSAAETTLKKIILINNGANDCWISLSGAVVPGDVAAANGGAMLRSSGMGVFELDNPGPLSIRAVCSPALTTILCVVKIV